ncbi:MAG: REP-associated tyrosine transposase [Alkaliphilus sp.]
MPRQKRKISETGIYHIMIRGINRQMIFEDDEDYCKFLEVLKTTKEKSEFEIYGYCLMGNHVHLLLREGKESLSKVMQRICSCFVYWYNSKYDRYGHLFQERFKSEVVENEAYLITVLRYIHQNPIKAGIVNSLEGYKWSSYEEYMNIQEFIDTEFVLSLFAMNERDAREEFKKYTHENNEDNCIEYEEKHRIRDGDLHKLMEEKYGVKKGSFHLLRSKEKNDVLRDLKKINATTIRQIVRVTGATKYRVERI